MGSGNPRSEKSGHSGEVGVGIDLKIQYYYKAGPEKSACNVDWSRKEFSHESDSFKCLMSSSFF